MKHIPPELRQNSFHCPLCGVLALQQWSDNIKCYFNGRFPNGTVGQTSYQLTNTMTALCSHCNAASFWVNEKMIYPLTGNVEMANPDLPEDIKNDYDEAKNIVNISPRGAAALL